MRLRNQSTRLAVFALAAVLTVAYASVHAAVRPPKLQYQITTLENGLRVILSEDHSTRIGHVSRRLEERACRSHRVRASLRAHDVQGLQERRARIAHLDHCQRWWPQQ